MTFLLFCIFVIVFLAWLTERQSESISLSREKIQLDKQLYLNLRKQHE